MTTDLLTAKTIGFAQNCIDGQIIHRSESRPQEEGRGEEQEFRQAESIRGSFEAELYFYSKIFTFALTKEIERVRTSP